MPPTPLVFRRATPQGAAAFVRLIAEPGVFGNLMQRPCPTRARSAARRGSGVAPEGGAEPQRSAERDGAVVDSLSMARLHSSQPQSPAA
jgi:hypothetical protein